MAGSSLKVALAVSGSIASYKAVEVARRLIDEGVDVLPLMTSSAKRFLGPLTLSGICGAAVVDDMFDDRYAGEAHVDIGRSVDLVAIVPATADLLARLAQGRADDLVSALCLSAACPIVVAPAMHSRMWMHPATQRNVATLLSDERTIFVGPVEGALASGERGLGRLAEPQDIVAAVLRELGRTKDLVGLRVVVTAGPTVEDIDPVRFVSNRSSGRMGFALAERAAARGASVRLVSGPVELPTPRGVDRIDVRSAADMKVALAGAFGRDLVGADALVMSAAVADYTPREPHAHKMKKAGETIALELTKTPDILAEIGHARGGSARPILVGFAVETADDDVLVAYAQKKLRDKKVDLIVANRAADSFGRATNRAALIGDDAADPFSEMSKEDLADQILDRVRTMAVARGILSC